MVDNFSRIPCFNLRYNDVHRASKAKPLKFREYESTVQPYKNRVNIIRASINNVVSTVSFSHVEFF